MGKNNRSDSIGTNLGSLLKNNEDISTQFDVPNESSSKKANDKKQGQPNAGQGSNKKVRYLPINEGPHAPYNFIPVRETKRDLKTKAILEDPCKVKHSEISDNAYSGELRYCFTAQTPIFVGEGGEKFYRNKDDKYAIPGSTMRGLIRANVQILGFSSVRDDIDDYHLMYRAVAGGALRKEYADALGQRSKQIQGHQMTILENVKAGYISREGSSYYLYNNIGDSNGTFKDGEADYYIISERYVLEKKPTEFAYIVGKFQNELPFKKEDRNGKTHYKGKQREEYIPYKLQISYVVKDGKVEGIAKENKLNKSGYVLSSGMMQEKKAFYVIPEIDKSTKRKISQEAIRSYQIDCKRKENTIPKQERKFYRLPEDGETWPVFYIELGEKLYLGYTPHLRVMYEHTILDGVTQDHSVTNDFAKMMFGFSEEKSARKSKVFFADAVLVGASQDADKKRLALSEPKPTSYMEYLKQEEGEKPVTYNDPNMELRGVKQYWLHDPVEGRQDKNESDNDNIKSDFIPLKKNCSFKGAIRFQNLSKEELGLLLWSVVLEEDSQMNLGKAKAYGYGRIKVDSVDLYLMKPEATYATSIDALSTNPYEETSEEEIREFIATYQTYAEGTLGLKDIKEDPTIRDFLAMKDGSRLKQGKTIEYMTLEEYSDHKQKNHPLPKVEMICESEDKHNGQ